MSSVLPFHIEINALCYIMFCHIANILDDLEFMRLELEDGRIPKFPATLNFASIPTIEDDDGDEDEEMCKFVHSYSVIVFLKYINSVHFVNKSLNLRCTTIAKIYSLLYVSFIKFE